MTSISNLSYLNIKSSIAYSDITCELTYSDIQLARVEVFSILPNLRRAADISIVQDALTVDVNKYLTDTSSIEDFLSFAASLGKTDLVTYLESIKLALNKSTQDTTYLGDSVFVGANKGLADSISITELVEYVRNRYVYYLDTASGNELLSLFLAKNLQDTAVTTDTNTLQLGKQFIDTGVTSASGILLNQDYVNDPYYFAEDYVGDARTLT